MYLLFSVFMVCAVVAGAGCANSSSAGFIENKLTPQEAFDLIQGNQDNPDFMIIDIRTPAEFTEGHIDGAINIDYYQDTFREKLNALDKDSIYLIYCRTGNRSSNAIHIMEDLGFREINHLTEGIAVWQEEGLPVVR